MIVIDAAKEFSNEFEKLLLEFMFEEELNVDHSSHLSQARGYQFKADGKTLDT